MIFMGAAKFAATATLTSAAEEKLAHVTVNTEHIKYLRHATRISTLYITTSIWNEYAILRRGCHIKKAGSKPAFSTDTNNHLTIKAICVHDFGPCGDKVLDEFLFVVILRINFCVGAQH
jgi:hypothetical protein